MATKKINYDTVYYRSMILKSIPFRQGDRTLDDDTATAVLLLSAKYSKLVEAFNAVVSDAIKAFKEQDKRYEGFDNKAQEFAEMERIDSRLAAHEAWREGDKDADGKPVEQPAKPSDEELKRAEELRARDDREDFYKNYDALREKERDLRIKHSRDEVDEPSGFSPSELQGILRCVGATGTIRLAVTNPVTGKYDWPCRAFLELIAESFC